MGRKGGGGGGGTTPATRINGTRQPPGALSRQRNLQLTHAIVDDGRSQRQLSLDSKIPEQRLSAIIRNMARPTAAERRSLSRELGRSIAYLFSSG